jgi:hypothetical protein
MRKRGLSLPSLMAQDK